VGIVANATISAKDKTHGFAIDVAVICNAKQTKVITPQETLDDYYSLH